jgi:protease-4
MKQFFKFLFASMFGFILAIGMLFLIVFIMISVAISDQSEAEVKEVEKNSILHIEFKEQIQDRAASNPLENFSFIDLSNEKELGLDDVIRALNKAKTDDKIKGIYLNFQSFPSGFATNEEIRNALLDFKTSKKPIYAYNTLYTQGAYYMVSVADKIFLHPQGLMEVKGLGAQLMFFKGALEKLEVEPQIIRHGRFKSAVEPYMLDKMSDDNRLQTRTYMGSLWNYWKEGVAKQRKLKSEEVQQLADGLLIRNAKDALKYKMIDQIAYQDEVLDALVKMSGVENQEDLKLVKLSTYAQGAKEKLKNTNEKIAVIYANGEIKDGEGSEHVIGGDRISKAVREARLDDKVKAIVLRVNSPGGSSLASDLIWREVMLAKKVKPVVASMGDVAASGGYYISCATNKIFASPNTITGSIGVFGLMFSGQKLLNNKLGISIDTVLTAKYGDFGTLYRPLSPFERQVIQNAVEEIYDDFIAKVGEGRKMSKAAVDSIGQGRVWSGIDAKKIGLVDEFGGLDKAIAEAAKLAKLDNYRLISLPKQKEPFQQLMEEINGGTETYLMEKFLGQEHVYYKKLKSIRENTGILMRMPFDVSFN